MHLDNLEQYLKDNNIDYTIDDKGLITVNGNLILKNYKSGNLKNLTTVKGNLYLKKYESGDLTNLTTVKGYLNLRSYKSGDLTKLTTVNSNLFLNIIRYIKGDLTRFKDKIIIIVDMEKYTKRFYLEYLILYILNKNDLIDFKLNNDKYLDIKFKNIEKFFKENNK